MPIYAIFVQKIGGDILDASGAIALFLFVSGIGTIVIHKTHWSEKHRAAMMIIGWFVWLAGIISYFWVSTPAMLLVTQVLTALGNAIANPAFDAELAEHVDKKMRNFEWSIYEGSQDIFAAFAALIGGFVVSWYGFEVLIWGMVVSATLSTALIVYYVTYFQKRLRS